MSSGTKRNEQTAANVDIEWAHHELREGDAFYVSDYDASVDVAAPKYFRIVTPDTTHWSHLLLELQSDDTGTWELFENPTVDAGGNAMTEHNHNRNSGTAATLAWFADATSTDDGTLLMVWWTGSSGIGGSSAATQARSDNEFILKQNEEYFLKFTPDNDGTGIVLYATWYEHTNRP